MNERLFLRLDGDELHGPEAHLAKEFRALCGLSPTEFLARATSGSSKTGS